MLVISKALEEFKVEILKLHVEKYDIYDSYNRGLVDGAMLVLNQLSQRAMTMYKNATQAGNDLVC